jgi:hypothetical protein
MTTFYFLWFETPTSWWSRSPYLYTPGTGWPGYTPRHWVLFSSPPTTCRATVEVLTPLPWQGILTNIKVKVIVTLRLTVSQSVLLSSPIWGSWPDNYYCFIVTVLSCGSGPGIYYTYKVNIISYLIVLYFAKNVVPFVGFTSKYGICFPSGLFVIIFSGFVVYINFA